jgi:hypothetical protein
VLFTNCASSPAPKTYSPNSGNYIHEYRPAFFVGDNVSVISGDYAQSVGTVLAVDMNENSYRVRLVNRETPVLIKSNFLKKYTGPALVQKPVVQQPAVQPIPVIQKVAATQGAEELKTGGARLAILPIAGLDDYLGETIAWHLANQDVIHTNFNVVPITPNIRKNITAEQSYGAFFDAGEDVHADYIMASFAKTVGYQKVFFTVVLDVKTRQQLAGDYRKYDDAQELSSFFAQMTKKIMNVIKNNNADAPRLSVDLMAVPPNGISKNDAAVLTQLLAIDATNTNKYKVFPRTSSIDDAMLDYETGRTTARRVFVNKDDLIPSDFLLSSKISILDSKNEVLAEIINVCDNVLQKGAHIDFILIEDIPDLLGRLAAQVTGSTKK